MALAFIFLLGGLQGLLVIAMPHWPVSQPGLAVAVSAVGLSTAGAILLAHRRLPFWAYHVLLAGGTVAVTVGVYACGPQPSTMSGAYFYFFVTLYAAAFFDVLALCGHLTAAAVMYAMALWLHPQPAGPAQWVQALFVLTGIGATVAMFARDSRQARRQAEIEADRFESLARAAPVGIFEADADKCIVFANTVGEEQIGRSAIGMTGDELILSMIPESHQMEMFSALSDLAAGRSPTVQLPIRDASGGERWLAWSAAPAGTGLGPFAGAFVTTTDVTELKAAQSKLSRLAMNDELTGLPNRRALFARLPSAFARLNRQPGMVAVLFLDLDGFKAVNDTYGHAAGDEALQVVARRVQSTVRADDTVARIGGDEFVVVLERVGDAAQAAMVAEKLIGVIGDPITLGKGAGQAQVRVSACVGVAMSGNADQDADTLLRDADAAMFAAKRVGPGSCEMSDPAASGPARGGIHG